MLEIFFGESAAGAMKLAARGSKKKTEMPEIMSLPLYLDIGSISDIAERKPVLARLFEFFSNGKKIAGELYSQCLQGIERIKREENAARIWVMRDCPDELCGLYYVCSLLEHTGVPVYCVPVPRFMQENGAVICLRGTGEMPPVKLACLAEEDTVRLLPAAVTACAREWNRLKSENAALRTVVNGRITGADENFYDFYLRRNIPEGKFVCALAIGKTLPELAGVSDAWLFLRIMNMIENGELTELARAKKDHPYSGVLIKSSGRERGFVPPR